LDGRGTGIVILGGLALAATMLTINQSIEDVREHLGHGDSLVAGILDGLMRPPSLVPAMLWAVVALQLQLPLAAFRAAKARGFLPREIWFAALRQPLTWRFFWYPARFRRKEDVWHRLPAPYRRARGFATLALGVLFSAILTSVFIARPNIAREFLPDSPTLARFLDRGLQFWVISLALTWWSAVAASTFSLFQAYRLMRARGFDQFRLHRVASALLYGPTADRSVWKQPDVAALLAPPGEAANKPPATPGEYETAISRIAAGLSGDANSAAVAAAAAASRFAEEIARIDRSLPGLERDADPKETQRVEARLAALAPDTDERRELLEILRKERDVLKRCTQRLEEARAGRARNLEALNSLWLSAHLLKASPTKAASQIRSLVGPAEPPLVTVDIEAPTRARSADAGTSGDLTDTP
jgi:hypothetical protein